MRETLWALTSLSPAPAHMAVQQACVASWRRAGLAVRSFNHPSEIARFGPGWDVEFSAVEQTTAHIFGRHYVPINVVLEWAARAEAVVLIINSDIELRLAPWEMKRLRWRAEGGVCVFVRHNHDGNPARAEREPHGIDAFLLHGRDAGLFGSSFLCMGQPFWDYWIPYTFSHAQRPVLFVDFPAALHRRHPRHWSWEHWHWCAIEFNRLFGLLGQDRSIGACIAMSLQVRSAFEQHKQCVLAQPVGIREWVERMFSHSAPKTFLELGAHTGTDTAWMAALPNVSIHAFEPDPRNAQPPRPNLKLRRAAVGDHDGQAAFILSARGWGHEWTHSSSLRLPKHHLDVYPVTFGETIEVDTVTLDTYCREEDLQKIDFIWADIQGAEGDMIHGGSETLRRTRYLYTEYSDDELYEGQVTLRDILDMLPTFRVLELWPDHVLLENRSPE